MLGLGILVLPTMSLADGARFLILIFLALVDVVALLSLYFLQIFLGSMLVMVCNLLVYGV